MSPPFIFRIDEIQENPDWPTHYDRLGNWIPCIEPGANVRRAGGVSGRYWFCDTQRIYQIQQLPQGVQQYKAFSVYYAGGQGFLVMRGDVAAPPPGDNWHPLRFDHNPYDYSSFLTNAGEHSMLRVQRLDQAWPRLLLPDIYHTPTLTPHQQYGGLTGELPIFLALIAFSTSRDWLPNILPTVFQNGAWVLHQHPVQRTNQRGVVVTVFTCPSTWANGSTAHDLDQYEHGNLGKYLN